FYSDVTVHFVCSRLRFPVDGTPLEISEASTTVCRVHLFTSGTRICRIPQKTARTTQGKVFVINCAHVSPSFRMLLKYSITDRSNQSNPKPMNRNGEVCPCSDPVIRGNPQPPPPEKGLLDPTFPAFFCKAGQNFPKEKATATTTLLSKASLVASNTNWSIITASPLSPKLALPSSTISKSSITASDSTPVLPTKPQSRLNPN